MCVECSHSWEPKGTPHLRDYHGIMVVNNPLMRPYLPGGVGIGAGYP